MIIILKIIYIFFIQEIKKIYSFLLKIKIKKKIFVAKNKYNFFNKYLDNDGSYEGNTLITSFLNIFDYLKFEHLIGIYLAKITKTNILVLVNKKDIRAKKYFDNVGLENIIYFDEPNFFNRIKNLIISYNYISKIKSFNEFIDFNYKGLAAGKIIYSHHTRFSGIPTSDKIRLDYYYLFSIFIGYYDEFDKIINKNKINYSILGETQFMPQAIFFGIALKNKIPIFSRVGGTDKISVRQVSDMALFFDNRTSFDYRIVEKLAKEKNKDSLLKQGKKIVENRFSGKSLFNAELVTVIDDEFIKLNEINKINLINEYNKLDICNTYNWNLKKPIGVILANDLTDGLFTSKREIYLDNFTWLKKTIIEASKNKSINWLIKPHPCEIKNKVTLTTLNLFKKLNLENNVQLMPADFSQNSLPKVVNIVLTNFGSAGYEYPAIGIPVITASEAIYSYLDITIEAQTESQYFELIKNCHKINKVSVRSQENAQLFAYLFLELTQIPFPAPVLTHQLEKSSDIKFWNAFEEAFKKFDHENKCDIKNDIFYKSFYDQILNKRKHALHSEKLKELEEKY